MTRCASIRFGSALRRPLGADGGRWSAFIALARPGLLAGLHVRRDARVPRPLLRLPLAVRLRDAGPRSRRTTSLQTYVFWELVGLGSYLLIGFWFEQPAAGARRDEGLLDDAPGRHRRSPSGIVVLLWHAGRNARLQRNCSSMADGRRRWRDVALRSPASPACTSGAMGKSAQFPFHVWLPDAMEGPDAGLGADPRGDDGGGRRLLDGPDRAAPRRMRRRSPPRSSPSASSPRSSPRRWRSVERDIKRILAYSTVSQLGFMMARGGVRRRGRPRYFHLLTHAFFKALLFLAAGSVIHAAAHQRHLRDGRPAAEDAGQPHRVPVGALALCGVFPTAGFFSKDEVLASVLDAGHPVAFAILIAITGMTAFYIGRAWLRALRWARTQTRRRHAHEPPAR